MESQAEAARIERWDGDAGPMVEALTEGFSDAGVSVRMSEPDLRRLVRFGWVDPARSWVSWAARRPTGALLGVIHPDRSARVQALAVRPEARRSGLARRLMTAFLQECPRGASLEVMEDASPARALYAALGFADARALVAVRGAFGARRRSRGIRPGALSDLRRDDRPERPGFRDIPALLAMPDLRIAADDRGNWIAWLNEDSGASTILDIGGRIDAGAVDALLGALPVGGWRMVGIPEDDPLLPMLLAARGIVYARQREMIKPGI